MLIGCPREIKPQEFRVGMTPAAVLEAVGAGHSVIVEAEAGLGSGFTDDAYREAGAEVVETAEEIFERAEMIVKVKEPQPAEYGLLRQGQILFTYLHLAPDRRQTEGLLAAGATAIAYETVTDARGGLPLLAPMSEVAGRMAVQVGARCLEKEAGGAGILLSGVPGVRPGRVCIIGGGVVGSNAARIAAGMRARATVLDKNVRRLDALDQEFEGKVATVYATMDAIEREVLRADLVIGAVLVPGAAAPRLVSRATVAQMKPGSVLVDVAIDQGGCFETSRPTTHAEPTYITDGIVHYCVTNMPGAVARTSAAALNNATLPFVLALTGKGWRRAMAEDRHLLAGLNVHAGRITHPAVAAALGEKLWRAEEAIVP